MAVSILAVETSCDDTSAAIIKDGKVCSNVIYGQEIHKKYGGVIPEAASRLHIQYILPVIKEALIHGHCDLKDLDAVAYTQSPGLIGSLLVGCHTVKGIAQVLNIPSIAVQHLHAHVLSNLIDKPKPKFPFLCLTVSGGHTQIVICKSPADLEIIGSTIDDAAGEAFDKTAKMLNLEYPGGPLIDRNARSGNGKRFSFAKPKVDGLNFSFSGLKTSVLYFLQKQEDNFIETNLTDLCASIQETIVDILLSKLKKAVEQTGIKEVCLAGGVSANSQLRQDFILLAEKNKWNHYIPKFEYCTDNAGMIGMSAWFKYQVQDFADLSTTPSARVELN